MDRPALRPAPVLPVRPLRLCPDRRGDAQPAGEKAAEGLGLEPAGALRAAPPAALRADWRGGGPAGLRRRRTAALPGAELERPAGQPSGGYGPAGGVFRPHPHAGAAPGDRDCGDRRGRAVSVAQ